MRLMHIETVDFRLSEATNYILLLDRYPNLSKLGANDVVLLRSRSGDQLVFLHGFQYVSDGVKSPRIMLRSEKLRLMDKETWNPLMLSDYAEQVGIRLDGIRKFEAHLKEMVGSVLKEAVESLQIRKAA